jgi:hypothetical protein
MRRVAKMLIVLALVTGACSDDDEPPASTTTSADLSSTSVTEPALEPGATTTTAKPGQTAGTARPLTKPEDSATHLFQAWQRGDRTEAGRHASQRAVDSLFTEQYSEPAPTFDGCTADGDHYNCTYRGASYRLVFRVEGSASDGYRVERVDYSET